MTLSAACSRSGVAQTTIVDDSSLPDAGTTDAQITGDGAVTDAADAGELDARADANITPASCDPVIESHALAASPHIPMCSPVVYETNPPSSGPHYPTWAAFGEYDFAVPRGFWLHNVEHGAIVVSYHCPFGCEDDLKRARAWLNDMLADAYCASRGGDKRVLLLPDPLLTVPWAASAWGVTLRAKCFDAEIFQGFFDSHVGKGPENICGPGVNLRTSRPAANCGELDN